MIDLLLREEISKRGYSVRRAAKEIGVASTTIARILNGVPADIGTLNKVCNWLGITVSSVLDTHSTTDMGIASKVAMIIEKEPKLASVFAKAAAEIEAGNMTSVDLSDIVAYAAYKINLSREGNNEVKA